MVAPSIVATPVDYASACPEVALLGTATRKHLGEAASAEELRRAISVRGRSDLLTTGHVVVHVVIQGTSVDENGPESSGELPK
jgi:hypothetical protein